MIANILSSFTISLPDGDKGGLGTQTKVSSDSSDSLKTYLHLYLNISVGDSNPPQSEALQNHDQVKRMIRDLQCINNVLV